MKAVIQRVARASIEIDNRVRSNIGRGLLILLGVHQEDHPDDAEWLAKKIFQMRIFNDENGLMNLSCEEVGGEYLVVSQFTLYSSTKKGNRPSYISAAKPEIAIPLYEKFIEALMTYTGKKIHTGEFGADMNMELMNSGPVTIIIDTKNKE